MTTESIDIRIREDGAVVVKRSIESVGTASRKTADAVDYLKGVLATLTAALAIDKIIKYADAWSAAGGQIAIATKSAEEATAVQNELFKSAQKTRSGFSDVVELYSRARRAGDDLGASQADLIKFTEGVGKALAIQHTSTTQASGALLQLGQALTGAKIQAQEFNSLIDGAPVILQTVAKHLEGTGGTIGGLTRLVKAGEVTNREFFAAFMAGAADLDADFKKSSATIGQGFTVISNAVMKYIGELDHALGVSNGFGKIAVWIADNMHLIAVSVAAVGVAIAVAFIPTAVVAMTTAVTSLFTLLAANPFTALAMAIAAAVVYLAAFKDEINAGIDDATTLGDVFRALGEQFSSAFDVLSETVSTVFGGLADFASSAYQEITKSTDEETTSWLSSYETFYDGVGTGFAGVVRGIARTLDAIGGLLTGLGIGIVRAFAGIPDALKEIFNRAYNAVVTVVEDMINEVIGGVNKLRALVGTQLIETVTIERADTNTKFFEQYGQNIANSIDDGFKAQGGFLENWVNSTFDRAAAIGKDRASKLGKDLAVDLTTPLGNGGTHLVDEKELKAIEKLKNELRSLLNTIAPVEGAKLELAKATDLLTKAEAKGLITADQHVKYLALLKQHYADIIDPLGKVNRELDEQAALLGLTAKAREVESQVMNVQKDLLSQGITLTQAETQALRDKLVALQQLNTAVEAQDQLLANSVGQRQAFQTQLDAMSALLANPTSGFTGGDAATQINNSAPDLFAGTQTAIDANLASFENMYAQIDALRAKNLINEQTAIAAQARVAVMYNEYRLKDTQSFFGSLASLSSSGNKRIAAIGKAAAMTQATIDGVLAVQKALAAPPGWPYNAGNVIAVGIQAAANVASIGGFELGGYTGNGGTKQPAGIVHGKEFVVNADGTARNRAALEAMNRGGTMVAGSQAQNVSIVVNNNADGTTATTKERDTPDGKQIEITIERVVRKQIKSGGGIADSLESQYGLNRAAGTVR